MYAPSIQRVLVRQGLLLAAALCILLPGVAAAQKVVTELSPKEMTKILTSMGFEVEARKDGSEADEPLWLDLAGYRTAVFLLNENTDAQLYIGFQQKISAERVNEWNQGHRFARAYRDKDGDAVLEADLDFTGGVTEANVKAWVKLYRDVLGEYVQFIRSEPVARAK